jgi:predicted permease
VVRKLANSIGLGILGLAIGCGVVFWAVSTWTELNTAWIDAACVVPLLFLIIGLAVQTTGDSPARRALRMALIPAAAVLGTAGNYLAYVITAHVWYNDKLPGGQQSLVFQLLHPGILPELTQRSSSSASFQQGWLEYVVVGLVAGAFAFWYITRRMVPRPAKKK